MGFVKIAETAEITAGNKKKVMADGKEILLVNVGDAYYALSNKCPHMGGSLAEGKLEGSVIACPRHGAQFDVKTGKNVQGAKLGFINMKVKDATKYAVKVEGKDILVELD